jgi:hypothetical protein
MPVNFIGKSGRILEETNQGMMKISRILIPVNYSGVDPFDMDPAVPIAAIPRLAPLEDLGKIAPDSPAFKFLERRMVRERNRIIHALEEANEIADEVISQLKELPYPPHRPRS